MKSIGYLTSRPSLNNRIFFCLWFVILFFSLLIIVPGILNRPFSTKGEPREALAARAMIETGNWVLPERLEGEFPTKPPMTHWLIALVAKMSGGMSEAAARAPSAILAILVNLLLFRWVATRLKPDALSIPQAVLSVVILSLAIEWQRASITSRVDMTLSAFLVMGFISAYNFNDAGLKGYPWLMLFCFSMATLTKGPVGLLLPMVGILLFYLLESNSLKETMIAILKVFVPALLVCGVWYVLAYLRGGNEFLQIAIKENAGRFLGRMEDTGEPPHAHGILYMLMTLVVGFLPWTIPMFLGVCNRGICDLKKISGSAISWIRGKYANMPKMYRFASIVSLVFILFFSVVKSKRSVYLLPIYPFLSLLVAARLEELYHSRARSLRISMGIIAGILVLASVFVWAMIFFPSMQTLAGKFAKVPEEGVIYTEIAGYVVRNLSMRSVCLLLTIPILAVAMLIAVWRSSWLSSISIGLLLYVLTLFNLNALILPKIASQLSAKSFVAEVVGRGDVTKNWYSFGDRLYGLSYYLHAPLKQLRVDNLPQGSFKVLLLERESSELIASLGSHYVMREVARSKYGVEKPLDRVLLLEFEPRM